MIRKICASDLQKMSTALDLDFADGWNLKMLTEGFNGGSLKGLVKEDGGEILAFVTYMATVDTADILDVYVFENSRGKGYAKQLINGALQEIKKQNIKRVFLEVKESNVPAISLYSGFGFETISVRKKYYADGANALVQVKEL